jgi:adenine-specific DNA-methyltransferase
MTAWGPNNPHPLSRMKTELVWEGKYDEYGNRRAVRLPASPLPLQRIETIDQPRDARKARARQLGLPFSEEEFDQQAHRDDWRNMLIWGDNKLVMAALLEQFRGQIDLIYIDPPFDVGADFTVQVQLGEEGDALQKEQSILEAVAYRDTWGKGTDSYLHMMYERLMLMRELLAEEGSIYVHIGPDVSHYVGVIMDEVLGPDACINEIIWQRTDAHSNVIRKYGTVHDTLLFYCKTPNYFINLNAERDQLSESALREYSLVRTVDGVVLSYRPGVEGRRFKLDDVTVPGVRPGYQFTWRGATPSPNRSWPVDHDTLERWLAEGKLYLRNPHRGAARCKVSYLDENEGIVPQDLWINVGRMKGGTIYQTGKPERLLERIIKISSRPSDLVADFFCGSGTTLAVAEKLGRRWIGVDLGRYAIHTTRKRLIQVQRELHERGQPYRSFDVYNLGRYERQWWQLERLKGADGEHRRLVLRFYKAAPLGSSPADGGGQGGGQPPHPLLHGKKGAAYVYVDQIDSIFSESQLRAVADAARAAGGRELHCLAWEFEMELSRKKEAIEAETGLTIRLKYIPREIMEPNRTEVQFFEAGALEARVVWSAEAGLAQPKVDVELVHFTPALAEAPEAELDALRERAVRSPFDFIDFWAVDFDYSPDKPFEHHWQDFRTRKDRSLKTRTDIGWQYQTPGRHRIAVKVIDVFGVDTTIVVDVAC